MFLNSLCLLRLNRFCSGLFRNPFPHFVWNSQIALWALSIRFTCSLLGWQSRSKIVEAAAEALATTEEEDMVWNYETVLPSFSNYHAQLSSSTEWMNATLYKLQLNWLIYVFLDRHSRKDSDLTRLPKCYFGCGASTTETIFDCRQAFYTHCALGNCWKDSRTQHTV